MKKRNKELKAIKVNLLEDYQDRQPFDNTFIKKIRKILNSKQ